LCGDCEYERGKGGSFEKKVMEVVMDIVNAFAVRERHLGGVSSGEEGSISLTKSNTMGGVGLIRLGVEQV
jgi:hypothetical protein